MAGYRLTQISASVYNITQNRVKVGQAVACPKGYVARIGQYCEVHDSAKAAFEAVAALALGFDTPAALRQANAITRQQNAARRAAFRPAANAMRNGDISH